jgi:hypothetical protein
MRIARSEKYVKIEFDASLFRVICLLSADKNSVRIDFERNKINSDGISVSVPLFRQVKFFVELLRVRV